MVDIDIIPNIQISGLTILNIKISLNDIYYNSKVWGSLSMFFLNIFFNTFIQQRSFN